MTQHEPNPGLKPGDILEETDHFGPRRRRVFVRYNNTHRSGMDYSTERLNVCALCGHEEWVKELSRSTKWTRSGLTQLLPNVQYCPDHARAGIEVDRTLSFILKQEAADTIARMRERYLASEPPDSSETTMDKRPPHQ